KLEVRTPSGRSVEVFVSTQRLGGYVFWTKRRFQPASHRFAAVVLLADAEEPYVYLVPSTEWRSASPPLTNRDNIGKRSEPEYGISLSRSLVHLSTRSSDTPGTRRPDIIFGKPSAHLRQRSVQPMAVWPVCHGGERRGAGSISKAGGLPDDAEARVVKSLFSMPRWGERSRLARAVSAIP
ncbi:MAG: hypothetical protein ACLQA5_22755, partial [Solirubrobacteraceae bacterium]